MKETTALYPRVHAACDAILKEEGILPTADAVVKRIGGSKKTAHAGRLQWIEQLTTRLNWVQGLPEIPAEASEAMLSLWGALSKANEAQFNIRKSEIDQFVVEAEQRIQASDHDRDVANDHVKQMMDQIREIGEERDSLERQLDKETGRREEIESTVARANESVDKARLDADARVSAVQQVSDELRTSNDALSSEIAILSEQLKSASNNALDARKDRDMVSDRLDVLREELADTKAQLQGCMSENKVLQNQNDQLLKSLK